VVRHDIGRMVAHAYAAQFPPEVNKFVGIDAFFPGVAGSEDVYHIPAIWHFRSDGPGPEALVRGREWTYFAHDSNEFAAATAHSLSAADRTFYTSADSRPGRMRAGWGYFLSFPETATDFAGLSKAKLTMPVLIIGGEKANGEVLARQFPLVASDLSGVVLRNRGHWVMEEKPKETTEALTRFLGNQFANVKFCRINFDHFESNSLGPFRNGQ
jgi:pimeloyl-ACP methyl ester carboxylesterase